MLLDVNLPGLDGFAVAASLAAVCPAARIVLTSAELDWVPAKILQASAALAFVPKQELAVTDLGALFAGNETPASAVGAIRGKWTSATTASGRYASANATTMERAEAESTP